MANKCSSKKLYNCIACSEHGGLIHASNEACLLTEEIDSIGDLSIDITFAVGGEEEALVRAINSKSSIAAFEKIARASNLKCSVCSGAFFLAAIGALDNKSATTHWVAIERLIERFPRVQVKNNVLYTIDGSILTSAGVSTGVDLALEIVSRQHGRELSNAVAKRLVVSMHRPAHAPQIIEEQVVKRKSDSMFDELCSFLLNNINQTISIKEMAEKCAMSPRHFSRQFTAHIGMAPQKFFNRYKMLHAKQLLSRGFSIEHACKATGFEQEQGFSKRFNDICGVTPKQFVKSLQEKSAQSLYG